jgi:hypothetical protein
MAILRRRRSTKPAQGSDNAGSAQKAGEETATRKLGEREPAQKPAAAPGTPVAPAAGRAAAPAPPRTGSTAASPAATGATAARPLAPSAAAKPSEQELSERLDGIRGWLGDLDRTVNVRSRIGLVLAAIAIGAAGAAIYLALDAKHNSASNGDVSALRDQLNALKGKTQASAGDVTALRSSVNAARSQASTANATASKLQSQVSKLRSEVKDLQKTASNAPAATTPTVPSVPGATTTTPSGGGGGKKSP